MKFSYNWIQEYVPKKLPSPKELGELLTIHSFEVEDVRKVGSDHILDIDILPNRAHDALGHIGIARECAVLVGSSLKIPKAKPHDVSGAAPIKVQVKEKNLCSRYMALVIEGVSVHPSPKWLQSRLVSLGLKPINNVVDAANYVMLETGQPLHAFDLEKIDEQIIVRKARRGETITTLDDEKYKLDSSHLVIADKKDVLAIAGIKGGEKAEITKDTKTIVIESANFNLLSVRNTSLSLNLRTDSSYRFEHEVPIILAPLAIERVALLIMTLAGGMQKGKLVDSVHGKPYSTTIALRKDYMQEILGTDIPMSKAQDILRRLEFGTKKKGKDLLVSTSPLRLDVEREEDLIEEVGRIYGYENIEPKTPSGDVFASPGSDARRFDRLAKRTLVGLGASETYSLSFVSEKDKEVWGYSNLTEIENPISSETKYLRPSLIPRMLESGIANMNVGREPVLFEVGNVFSPRETERVCVLGSARAGDKNLFYSIKGIVDGFLNGLRISDIWYDPVVTLRERRPMDVFQESRRAQIKVGRTTLGWIGQIHPNIVSTLKGKGTYVAAELDFDELRKISAEEHVYTAPSKYPAVVRDIAIIIPKRTPIEQIIQKIHDAGGKLIVDIDLFDMYGSSVAFHIVFQAQDRTLSSKEVDEIMKKVEWIIKQEGWEVR